jgi:hypothetical protein
MSKSITKPKLADAIVEAVRARETDRLLRQRRCSFDILED